jgi:Tfp pilus assembly protein PilF
MRRWIALVIVVLAGTMSVSVGCAGASGQGESDEIRDAEWHYNMGAGYFENQKIYPAIRRLNKALEKEPKMAKAHFLLGFIYSGRKKYYKATRHYKTALEQEPNFYKAKNNLGSIYLEMGRWREAAKIFQELLDESMYPTPQLAHNNLGWAQYNLGRYSKAKEHLEMAIFLKPKMCLAYNNLGLTHKAQGNMANAVDNFEKAIRKCPNSYAEAHFNLAKIMAERGNSKARYYFEKCVEIEPDTNLGERCRSYLGVN